MEKESKSLINNNSKIPRFYALPKTHKPNIPMRPIVDFRDSSTYLLEKYLKNILLPLSKIENFNVNNGYEVVSKLKQIKIEQDESMVSFDVKSLFTKVPMKETLEHIEEVLRTDNVWTENSKLAKEDIITLTKICINSSYFQFRDKIYQQVDGTPMGSPLSPVLADLYLQSIEKQQVMGNSSVKLWIRYVDDIFCIIKTTEREKMLKALNNCHESIEFTMEVENNGVLPFLDVLIYKKGKDLGHKVYRKPTHLNKYLDFNSHHHKSQKIAVIDSLVSRGVGICDKSSIEAEINYVKSILKDNNYPDTLVNARINKILSDPTSKPKNKKEDRLPLPYVGPLTNTISHMLRRKYNIKCSYFSGPKLGRMVQTHKDKRMNENGVIYKATCETCDKSYIGQTKRPLKTRMKEHDSHIRHGHTTKSAIAEHYWEHKGSHNINLNNTKIIYKESNWYARLFKEGLLIQSNQKQSMNQDTGMEINSIWSSTLLPLIKDKT